jgi:hypothetical protein
MSSTNHRPTADRRSSPRFPGNLKVSCRPASAPKRRPWRGIAADISRGGIGLRLRHRVKPGQFLLLALRKRSDLPAQKMEAHVIHNRREPGGRWFLGCAFVKHFEDTELRALLDEV